MSTFRWNGRDWPQFDHPYNGTITNERAVEIPIALDYLASTAEGRGLEVGNVLAHYFTADELPPRWVVDKYEEHAPADPLDVFAITGSFDWIVSISTIEHVRNGAPEAPNPWGGVAALAYLRGLLAPGGTMLWTAGAGQNAHLDDFLAGDSDEHGAYAYGDPFSTMHCGLTTFVRERTDDPKVNTWTERYAEPAERVYGPTHGANVVWIGWVGV